MTRFNLRWACWLIGLLLAGCDHDKAARRPDADELLVGVLDDPVFYQPAPPESEPSGFEYDLLAAFAESQQKKLHIVPAPNPGALLDLLTAGEVDFIAAAPVRPVDNVRYTTPLHEARPLIVRHAEALPVDDPEALAGHTVEVLPGTIQEADLAALSVSLPIIIDRPRVTNGIDLLARVSEYHSELAATDSTHFDVAVNYFPDLVVAQELPGKVAYAWAFRVENDALRAAAEVFIADFRHDGRLAKLDDRYFGHLNRINPIGATQFIEDMRALLPRYRKAFQQAQAITGIDWRLLAALAYQESKWDPLATSYTGVRGIMMLTEETADRMAVGNRLDAAESIRAGAKYLAELMNRLPAGVGEPDRLWLALAAYNLGYGHLNGARQFAIGLKRDPTSWYEMKKVLPLLARPEYYERLKSGRARGGEAVIMVENIRTYFDILARFEPADRSPLQTGLAMQ
ncbi:MAG TPA: membrane-bound lytic murein transglycosylase MltF [Rhodocyclaceae bacterium]|nr:membrane-bound lytic murein transglycosylase MltF [Rhodocyclaceae bacterium]